MRRLIGSTLTLFLSTTAVLSAEMVTLFPSKDNTLFEDPNGALSNAKGTHLFVGRSLQPDSRRALIAFDLTGIPTGATIESAELTLHLSKRFPGGAIPVSAHRLLQNWGEASSRATGEEGAGANATSGDATWLHNFFNTSRWVVPGGDFDPLASATANINGLGNYSWSGTGLLGDVQDWLAHPNSNFGWLLLGDESEVATALRFDSRENTNPAFRPSLMIHYTAVPEPGAGVALLSLLILRKCRRRALRMRTRSRAAP